MNLEEQEQQPCSGGSVSSAYTLPLEVTSLIWRAMQPAGPATPTALLRVSDYWGGSPKEVAFAQAIADSIAEDSADCQDARGALRMVCRDFSKAMLPHVSSLAYQEDLSDGVALRSLLTKLGQCGRSSLLRLDLGEADAGPTLQAPEALAALDALQALRVVVPGEGDAHMGQLRVAEVVQLLGSCPGLLELELESCVSHVIEVAIVLRGVPGLPQLQCLRLHGMSMGAQQLADLQQLLQTHLTALVELDMEGTHDIDEVTPAGVAAAALAHGRLARLRLSHWSSGGEPEVYAALAQALGAQHGCSLEALDMDRIDLHSEFALQVLRRNTQLKELGLFCEFLDEVGHAEQVASLLAGLTGLTQLRLSLNHNNAALAAQAVAGSTGLRSLSYRVFEDMEDLVMKGVAQLAAALRGLALLEELHLRDIVFDSGSSLAQLLRLPALRRLYVDVMIVRATLRDAADLAAALASLKALEYAGFNLKFADSGLSSTTHEVSLAAAAAIAALPAAAYDRQNHGGILMRLAAAVAHALPAMPRLRHLDTSISTEDDVDPLVCQDAAGLIAAAATLAPELEYCWVKVKGQGPADRLATALALPSES